MRTILSPPLHFEKAELELNRRQECRYSSHWHQKRWLQRQYGQVQTNFPKELNDNLTGMVNATFQHGGAHNIGFDTNLGRNRIGFISSPSTPILLEFQIVL